DDAPCDGATGADSILIGGARLSGENLGRQAAHAEPDNRAEGAAADRAHTLAAQVTGVCDRFDLGDVELRLRRVAGFRVASGVRLATRHKQADQPDGDEGSHTALRVLLLAA